MRIVTLSILVEDLQARGIENHMNTMMEDVSEGNFVSMGAFLARRKDINPLDVIIDFKVVNAPANPDKIVQITKLK